MVDETKSPDPTAELEQALSETIATISDYCLVRIADTKLRCNVLDSARQKWHDRYLPSYKAAINAGHHWNTDRDQVLKRAQEVGYLAANLALGQAILEELVRAGVIGQVLKLGQDIFLEPLFQPVVDSVIAGLAAGRIDCVMPPPKPEWIWCPTGPGTHITELARAVLPRKLDRNELERILSTLRQVSAAEY